MRMSPVGDRHSNTQNTHSHMAAANNRRELDGNALLLQHLHGASAGSHIILPQQHLRTMVRHTSPLKENTNLAYGGGGSGGGPSMMSKDAGRKMHSQPKRELEILDFHESWQEEIELYKDRMNQSMQIQERMNSTTGKAYTQRQRETYYQDELHLQRSPRGHSQRNQQLSLASGSSQMTTNKLLQQQKSNNLNAIVTAANIYNEVAKANQQAEKARKQQAEKAREKMKEQREREEKRERERERAQAEAASSSQRTRPRITVRNMVAGPVVMTINSNATRLTSGMDKLYQSATTTPKNVRPNNDATAAAASGSRTAKRYPNAPIQPSPVQTHPHTHYHYNTANVAINFRAGSPNKDYLGRTPASYSPPKRSPHQTKIIVNQFHASSLLNAQHQEDKAKLLAQNGLPKAAAKAYSSNPSAYMGVAMAAERNRGPSIPIMDDPCTAIDDVNEYSDSSEDEEYKGEPFFLPGEDRKETRQSQHIPYKPSQQDAQDENERGLYYHPKCILSPSIFPNVPPYLNFSSHAKKGPNMPNVLHKVLKWKLSPVMPKIVKRVVLNSGFRIIKNTTDWMAVWEKHMKSPGFRTIRSHQKYNHMPGSFRIGRKDTMWRSIHTNMKKFGSKEFGFMQKSYVMPDDLENLRQVWPKNASRLTKWIVKPPASARGTGIRIVNKWSQFSKDRPLVVQKYIERPLLINDNKFDMRLYVVVTSINPLRIYMYKDGLARFASVKYSSELTSLDERCMHLTNYSINKFSQNYSKNEDFMACQGHKWTLQSLWSCLEERGVNTKRLWATLRNLVIKAIISGEAGLNRMYRQNVNFRYNCFELFGFDVLLDENLVPWLLEINISPSLHSELPLDLHVKGPLIQSVLNTALYQVPPKLTEKQQAEIMEELRLKGPLCHDKRIFSTCLTADEVRKHNQYTHRSIELRDDYIEAILDRLMPDDVRCLAIAEDELARCNPLERIFPTPDTFKYLKFIDNPRYYNRLLDAWEHRYGHCREKGISVIRRLCEERFHVQVSDAAMEKEPNVTITDIDMLHIKKADDPNADSSQSAANEFTAAVNAIAAQAMAAHMKQLKSESPKKN